ALWTLWAARPVDAAAWGLVVALEALALAAVAHVFTRRALRRGTWRVVVGQLRDACREAAAAAGVLAVLLAGLPGGFPHSHTHSVTLLVLAPAWLLLARPFLH